MACILGAPEEILNADGADVVEGSASWFSIEGANKVLIFIDISGSLTVYLKMDAFGTGTEVVDLGSFTASDQKVLDDPTGRMKAYTNGCGVGETAKVTIRRVYELGR